MRNGTLNPAEKKLYSFIVERGVVVTDQMVTHFGWSKPAVAGLLGGLVKAMLVERIDRGRKPALFKPL